MRATVIAALFLATSAGGCAAPKMYHWGKYDEHLYAHYRAPQEREVWVANLKTLVLEAEQRSAKVPPGVYAEYGYALFEEGSSTEAATYFAKERDLWPESRPLMEKMIALAQRRGTPAASAGKTAGPAAAATALEGGAR